MDHFDAHRTSIALLATVMVSAGPAAPVRGAADGDGIIRRTAMTPDDATFQCVAPSEYEIAGLRLTGTLASMSHLGPPLSLTRGRGEDDGGSYAATTFRYDGLKVTVVRGEIEIVEARSALWPTPSGLRAGMPRREAAALLGHQPDPGNLYGGVYSFSGCPEWRDGELHWDNVNDYFEFAFGDDGRLSFIRLAAHRP